MSELGNLRIGDVFLLNGKQYKAKKCNGDNTVNCIELGNGHYCKISVFAEVEELKEQK